MSKFEQGDYLVADLFNNGSETLARIIGAATYGYPKDYFHVQTTLRPEQFIFTPNMSHRKATDVEILKARLVGLL
jgi:hypothetical protein